MASLPSIHLLTWKPALAQPFSTTGLIWPPSEDESITSSANAETCLWVLAQGVKKPQDVKPKRLRGAGGSGWQRDGHAEERPGGGQSWHEGGGGGDCGGACRTVKGLRASQSSVS